MFMCTTARLARRMPLSHLQLKRNIQIAGKRFTPTAGCRRKVQQSIASETAPSNISALRWMTATTAAIAVLVVVGLTATLDNNESARVRNRSTVRSRTCTWRRSASSSLVDVVSTDRHTVKPWFQGKIPFAFDLPELQNSEFSLLGGRMAYLDQTPGAHLIYDVRKHHISVFVFQERSLSLPGGLKENSFAPRRVVQHGNLESGWAALFRNRRR